MPHGNLKGLMGTWKVSWELEKSHENLVICITGSHGNLKGFILERSHGSLVICLTGSHETLKVS